jgi:pyrroline-5-carboxylate reductase
MKERIGVLGPGDVAKALAKGLKKHGRRSGSAAGLPKSWRNSAPTPAFRP